MMWQNLLQIFFRYWISILESEFEFLKFSFYYKDFMGCNLP